MVYHRWYTKNGINRFWNPSRLKYINYGEKLKNLFVPVISGFISATITNGWSPRWSERENGHPTFFLNILLIIIPKEETLPSWRLSIILEYLINFHSQEETQPSSRCTPYSSVECRVRKEVNLHLECTAVCIVVHYLYLWYLEIHGFPNWTIPKM